MLYDKLAQAEQDVARRRFRFGLLLLGLIAAAGLFLFGVIKIDLSPFQLSPAQTPSVDAGNASIGKGRDAPEGKQIPSRTSKEHVNAIPVPEPSPSSVPSSAASGELEFREAFKTALVEFERDVEPHVSGEIFAAWNKDRQKHILDNKADAIASFSAGKHEQAVNTLEGASRIALSELAARDKAFDDALASAQAAFEVDDYDKSNLNIVDALRLRPNSAEARDLKTRIDRLPEILTLIEKAGVARTENNLEDEERFLKQVLAADPSRTEFETRLKTVQQEVREQRFAHHIAAGLAGVDRRQLQAAQRNVKDAKAIFQGRSETVLLSEKVALLARELEAERFIREATLASQSDEWARAESLYQKAGEVLPNHREAVDGYALSKKINVLGGQLAFHLQAPHRIASSNVAGAVRELVADAQSVSAHSETLSKQVQTLTELLSAYATKVAVRVVSDGVTNISIRGVGRVGVATEKTIELGPGRYTFEGVRPGYRAKLLEVDIPPGTERYAVEIFCDERL